MSFRDEAPQEPCREDQKGLDRPAHPAAAAAASPPSAAASPPAAAASPPRARRVLNEAAHKLPSSLFIATYRGQQASHPRRGGDRR